jgi:hypothetical protein
MAFPGPCARVFFRQKGKPSAKLWRKHYGTNQESRMNLFDVSILGFLNFCLINGISRGLIKEGVSLMGVIVGFWAACYYYDRILLYRRQVLLKSHVI